jgi:GAF domain-containing protein
MAPRRQLARLVANAYLRGMADAQITAWPADKAACYGEVRAQIAAVIAGEPFAIARYATAVSLLRAAFSDRFFWCGFYLVDPKKPRELVVGPYQGTLGCLRIPFGKGVCGHVAATQRTEIVPDVHAFPGHIACDSRSNSEIVVPVFDRASALAAVLDVDSVEFAAFDAVDAAGLEAICADLLVVD